MSSPKQVFNEKLKKLHVDINARSVILDETRYNKLLEEVKEANNLKSNGLPMTTKQYRRLKRYRILEMEGQERLTDNKGGPNIRYYCKTEEMFDILEKVHLELRHKKGKIFENELKKNYCNITRQIKDLFMSVCKKCSMKKKILANKSGDTGASEDCITKFRCQVDVFMMAPDGEFNYFLQYTDCVTKFTILRPLKTKTAKEVAKHIMDIFTLFRAPFVMQSFNGRGFTRSILKELAKLWPSLKLVNGELRPITNSNSKERSVLELLTTWMIENNSRNWANALPLTQMSKNLEKKGMKTPHEAMFNDTKLLGLATSSLSADRYANIYTEEELDNLIDSLKETDGYTKNMSLNSTAIVSLKETNQSTENTCLTAKNNAVLGCDKASNSVKGADLNAETMSFSGDNNAVIDTENQLDNIHDSVREVNENNENMPLAADCNTAKDTRIEVDINNESVKDVHENTDMNMSLSIKEEPDTENMECDLVVMDEMQFCVVCRQETTDKSNRCIKCEKPVHDVCSSVKEDGTNTTKMCYQCIPKIKIEIQPHQELPLSRHFCVSLDCPNS